MKERAKETYRSYSPTPRDRWAAGTNKGKLSHLSLPWNRLDGRQVKEHGTDEPRGNRPQEHKRPNFEARGGESLCCRLDAPRGSWVQSWEMGDGLRASKADVVEEMWELGKEVADGETGSAPHRFRYHGGYVCLNNDHK